MNAAFARFVRCGVLVARNPPPPPRRLRGKRITTPRGAFDTRAIDISSLQPHEPFACLWSLGGISVVHLRGELKLRAPRHQKSADFKKKAAQKMSTQFGPRVWPIVTSFLGNI